MEFKDIDLTGIYEFSINGIDYKTTGEEFKNRLIELKVYSFKGITFTPHEPGKLINKQIKT